jgi:osmotically-inducible protein OsmY
MNGPSRSWMRSAGLWTVLLVLAAAGDAGPRAVETIKIGAAAPDDATLLRNVQSRIAGRPGVDASRVQAAVERGALSLTGTVASLYEREEIEKQAASVRGLAAVDNKIEIVRLDAPDIVLANEAERAISASPRLRALGVTVSAKDAVLSIDGEVPVARDREDVEDAASRVHGVQAIENHLRLTPVTVDPEITRKRIEALLGNKLVFGGVEDLKVEVAQDGVVTLSGIVLTYADRLAAERFAYGVRGVSKVDNRLAVRRFKTRNP